MLNDAGVLVCLNADEQLLAAIAESEAEAAADATPAAAPSPAPAPAMPPAAAPVPQQEPLPAPAPRLRGHGARLLSERNSPRHANCMNVHNAIDTATTYKSSRT